MEEQGLFNALAASARDLSTSVVERLQGEPEAGPDTVHDFRTTTKRLRSYWLLAESAVGPEVAGSYRNDLRDAARPFAASRDHSVRDSLLGELQEKAGKKKSRSIAFIREELFQGDVAADGPPGADGAIAALAMDAERWRQHAMEADHSDDLLVRDFETTLQKSLDLGVAAIVLDTERGYHRWRRWVKYAYYQYAWFAGRWDVPGKAERRLKRLGSLLGRLHDAHHLLEELDKRSVRTSSPRSFRDTFDAVAALEARSKEKTLRLARRVLSMEPPVLGHELLEAVREAGEGVGVPNLEFSPLASHEGDGAGAAARTADPH